MVYMTYVEYLSMYKYAKYYVSQEHVCVYNSWTTVLNTAKIENMKIYVINQKACDQLKQLTVSSSSMNFEI